MELIKAGLSGNEADLSLILDSHQADIFGTERGSFWVRLSQAEDAFDVSDAFLVDPGMRTTIFASYLFQNITKSASGFSPEMRGCNLKEEVTDDMKRFFKFYTRRSCIYSCLYEKAESSFGCVPWNYFHDRVCWLIEITEQCLHLKNLFSVR